MNVLLHLSHNCTPARISKVDSCMYTMNVLLHIYAISALLHVSRKWTSAFTPWTYSCIYTMNVLLLPWRYPCIYTTNVLLLPWTYTCIYTMNVLLHLYHERTPAFIYHNCTPARLPYVDSYMNPTNRFTDAVEIWYSTLLCGSNANCVRYI
jgi:hypothetical protein